MRIRVDHQDSLAFFGQRRRKIHGERRLSDATLVVEDTEAYTSSFWECSGHTVTASARVRRRSQARPATGGNSAQAPPISQNIGRGQRNSGYGSAWLTYSGAPAGRRRAAAASRCSPGQRLIPGAASMPHRTLHGGHFIQEDAPHELAAAVRDATRLAGTD